MEQCCTMRAEHIQDPLVIGTRKTAGLETFMAERGDGERGWREGEMSREWQREENRLTKKLG